MEKKIGYELIIKVSGFQDAKRWIYDLIDEGIVKCGQCDQPATHVFWQDQAEWYCRCDQHREYGPMWTGSTSWRPVSFSLNVIKDTALTWLDKREPEIKQRVRFNEYDATNYYELTFDDYRCTPYYLVGGEKVEGFYRLVKVFPLTNGEFAYEREQGNQHKHGGSSRSFGLVGSWATEAEALEAAKKEWQVRDE